MKTSLQTSRNALHFFRIGYVQRTVTIMHRFLLSVILFISVNASAQVTQTFNTNGTFTVPAGVNSITVGCWGGGGAGGTRTSNGVAGGGGGGAYSSSVIAVTPGDTYSFVVGAGGTSGSPATAGGDTWFGSATTVMAKGGNSVATNSQTGATGGAAGPGFGTIKNNGGNGRNGNTSGTDYGGGGGSSAGIAIGANGNNATTNAGANAPAGGGDGGDGRFSSQGNGQPGNVPGGGGGGGGGTPPTGLSDCLKKLLQPYFPHLNLDKIAVHLGIPGGTSTTTSGTTAVPKSASASSCISSCFTSLAAAMAAFSGCTSA